MRALVLGLGMLASTAMAQTHSDVSLREERAVSRLRGIISAQGGASVIAFGLSPFVAETFGLSGEVGSIIEDRICLGMQLSVSTNRNVGMWNFGMGGAFNFALSNRFWIGTGIGLHLITAGLQGSGLAVLVPVRGAFAFWGRDPSDVGRGSMFLSLELVGGVGTPVSFGFAPIPARPAPVGSALLSLGYAWW